MGSNANRILPTTCVHMWNVSRVSAQAESVSSGHGCGAAAPVRVVSDVTAITLDSSREVSGRKLVGGNNAEPTGLIVIDGLKDFLAGVHHERPVVGDRCADRQPAQQEHIERLGLLGGRGHPEKVGTAENERGG